MKFITRLVLLSLGPFFTQTSYAVLNSEIFTCDETGLHAHLLTEKLEGRELKRENLPFYQNLFTDPRAMKSFGHGVKPEELTAEGKFTEAEVTARGNTIEKYVLTLWLPRLEQGSPHAPMVFYARDESKPTVHCAVGPGASEPGVGTLGYVVDPDQQGKGYASCTVHSIVNEWSAEVRRIGLGIGLDEIQDQNIIAAFCCFKDRPLERLDATATPSNGASIHILEKNGFTAAPSLAEHSYALETMEDPSGTAVEDQLVKLYDAAHTPNPLTPGLRYAFNDSNGSPRTFGKDLDYGCIKYYFENSLHNHFR